jgi:hypothetical protein
MTKEDFINQLVQENFCTQFEAEEYSVFCGEDGWIYDNPFTKKRASQVQFCKPQQVA